MFQDQQFVAVVEDMKKLYAVVNPQAPTSLPDTFGVEELMSFMKDLMENMNVAMEVIPRPLVCFTLLCFHPLGSTGHLFGDPTKQSRARDRFAGLY